MELVIKALWHALLVLVVSFATLGILSVVTQKLGRLSANDTLDMMRGILKSYGPSVKWISVGIGIASYVMNRLEEIVEGEHARN